MLPGETLEVCLAQFWSSLGASSLQVRLQFRGALPSPSQVCLRAAAGPQRLDVRCHILSETLEPKAELNLLQRVLAPKGPADGK